MAPNNALGRPTAAAMRARAEGTSIEGTDARETVGETSNAREAVGDAFLGATICVLELGVYLALAADASRFDASAFLRLAVVVSLPQIYGRLRNNSEKKAC